MPTAPTVSGGMLKRVLILFSLHLERDAAGPQRGEDGAGEVRCDARGADLQLEVQVVETKKPASGEAGRREGRRVLDECGADRGECCIALLRRADLEGDGA